VVIVTGPPGAGKTSVVRALASTYKRAVLLESDQFFHFIRSGYIPPCKPKSHEQNTMVMRLVADTAAGYARHGYLTVIDGIVTPRWFLEPMRTWLAGTGHSVAYAVLRAPLATCLDRCSARPSRELSDRAVIEQLWHEFANLGRLERHVIDADDKDIEETTRLLGKRLGTGSLTLDRETAKR
jgi:predicted kinase